MEQKLFDAAARLPQTNATLDTSQIKTKSKVTNGVGRIVITLAACAAAICIILFGALSLAGEIRTYNEAVSYFSMHNLSTDGLSRKEIKDVYRDIITGSFTHPKTAGVLAGRDTTEPQPTEPTEPNVPVVLPEYVPGSIKLAAKDAYTTWAPKDRQYRVSYYLLMGDFADIVRKDHPDEYKQWKSEIDAAVIRGEWKNEMLLVTYIKRFDISRETMETALQNYIYSRTPLQLKMEFYEAPNLDIIYTFDNEIINRYYRYELAATDPVPKSNLDPVTGLPIGVPEGFEFAPQDAGEITPRDRKYRVCYYQALGPFASLGADRPDEKNAILNEIWEKVKQDIYRDEMYLVSIIKGLNISREEFDQAVAKYLLQHDPENLMTEYYEIPNGDIIYTFDNEIINAYYRYEGPDLGVVPPKLTENKDHLWYDGKEYHYVDLHLLSKTVYRSGYHNIWGEFLELANNRPGKSFDEWVKLRIAETSTAQTCDEAALVSFLKYFEVPKEDFEAALEKYISRHTAQELSWDYYWVLPDADIIYTFDNEVINQYYRKEDSNATNPSNPTEPGSSEAEMLAQYFDLEKTHRPAFDEVLSIQEGTPVSDVVELIGKPHGFAPSHNLVTFWWETVEGYTCLVDLSATLGYLSAPDTVERCFEFCTVDLVIPLIELEVQGSDTSENYDEAGIYNAVSKYFAQREAYLLSMASTIDNVIPGLIKDEDAHKAAIAEAGIEWQSSDVVIHSIAYWDSHAQVVATETVTYRKNGVEKTEAIIHRLQLGQVDDGRIFTARDLYYEAITGFRSCSYLPTPYQTPQPTLTKPTSPTEPPEQTDDPQAGGQDAHVHIYDQQNTAAEYCQAEATCQSAAYYYYSCICGEQGTTTFASGEKKEHSYTITTVAATCSSEGYKQHTCACGDSYKTDYTPQTYAHDFYQGRAVGHSDDGYDVAYSCYLCHNCDIKVERHGNVEENNHPTTNCYYYITGDLVNDRDYEIVIYGSGEMPHYNSGWLGSPVWFDYLHKTKSIIVAEGITTIGSYAFYCEDAEQTVTFTLPETLEIVHSYGIGVPTKDLYMGSTLRQIKPYAIAYNKVKGSIYLPKTLTLLGNIPLGKKLLYEGSLEDFMNIDTVAWQAVTSMGSQIIAMSEANKSMFWLYVNASDRYDDAVYWTEVQMPE